MLLAALAVWGFGAANSLCDLGGNECTNWTSDSAVVIVFWILIGALSITGLVFILQDIILSKDLSKWKKLALIVSGLSIIAIPYSIIITPVLFALSIKYVK